MWFTGHSGIPQQTSMLDLCGVKSLATKCFFQAHVICNMAKLTGTNRVNSVCLQKKSKDHFGLEGDEESTMLEDSVSPKK